MFIAETKQLHKGAKPFVIYPVTAISHNSKMETTVVGVGYHKTEHCFFRSTDGSFHKFPSDSFHKMSEGCYVQTGEGTFVRLRKKNQSTKKPNDATLNNESQTKLRSHLMNFVMRTKSCTPAFFRELQKKKDQLQKNNKTPSSENIRNAVKAVTLVSGSNLSRSKERDKKVEIGRKISTATDRAQRTINKDVSSVLRTHVRKFMLIIRLL